MSEQKSQLSLDYSAGDRVAGVDEAGRGPLAGPVVAAAVILDPARPIPGLADSKKLTARRRAFLRERIEAEALAWAVGRAEVEEIDRYNILQASFLAMRRAVDGLNIAPDLALVDGNACPPLPCVAEPVVGGDNLIACIAAASILAKEVRDAELIALDAHYPVYGFARHKGYGTAVHMQALREHGPCPLHRRSFAPIARMLGEEAEA